jgi:hypothetical protein
LFYTFYGERERMELGVGEVVEWRDEKLAIEAEKEYPFW